MKDYPCAVWHVTHCDSSLGEAKLAIGERGKHNEIVILQGLKHGKRKSEIFFSERDALLQLIVNEKRRRRLSEKYLLLLIAEAERLKETK